MSDTGKKIKDTTEWKIMVQKNAAHYGVHREWHSEKPSINDVEMGPRIGAVEWCSRPEIEKMEGTETGASLAVFNV